MFIVQSSRILSLEASITRTSCLRCLGRRSYSLIPDFPRSIGLAWDIRTNVEHAVSYTIYSHISVLVHTTDKFSTYQIATPVLIDSLGDSD